MEVFFGLTQVDVFLDHILYHILWWKLRETPEIRVVKSQVRGG